VPVLSLVPKKAQAFIKPDDLVFYVTCTYDPRQMRPGAPACKGVPAGPPRPLCMLESLLRAVLVSEQGSDMRARACRGSHAQLITLPAELIDLANTNR